KDVENLSSLFDQKIVGFAYPYGVSDEACTKILQSTGIRYARTIKTDKSFRFPQDPLHMPMSCWHVSKKAFETLDAFINARADEADMFFLMFAHGYEFDFNTSESNWDKFEEICKRVSAHADIICCSTKDAFRMHEEDKNV
ncbi:MAG: hypothetical protein IKD94_04250, partial [Erysipelotrichaceae bacterium]|nr:hypothetical protein [Erysipelotrichaceae bacterium]